MPSSLRYSYFVVRRYDLSSFGYFFVRLLIRPPPTSPLFPYTTLFRSDRSVRPGSTARRPSPAARRPRDCRRRRERSEEHTSELQSLRHLVCRLLLEKKKTP